ncbi:IMPACT family protein [Runella salmonicolor]|uniref:YigZ family protein n=1 Tax=Runella salmonicolor TaxID=2950278 RepID=A0ABT1FN58_9BACT|nr:YigZ family protein [Runella salmonicolor]MCP1383198.1 YigZ family protein [Runella salmonicolor]
MLFDDSYRTIVTPVEGLFRDRGSKFLAFGYPIQNEEDVKQYLTALREIHPKANHHCYAYRLGLDRTHFRANDDGEPSGSAGKPILNTLYAHDITNLLVVVVRYFGGTLLGVPGLINAYKVATEEALSQAQIVTKHVRDVYTLTYPYEQMNEVMKVIKAFDLTPQKQQFDNECSLQIEIRKTLLNQVLGKLEKIEALRLDFEVTI